jgi:3-deoxy-D-manno-octulosonic-acid transferase
VIEPLYRALTSAAAPWIRRWLQHRAQLGKEDPARLGERQGIAGCARPAGPLVWVHAASVGEAMSVLPLVRRLRERWPAVGILFTSGTVTSARLLAERLPAGCFHQFAPLDVPAWIARFLDFWEPEAVLWVESEFWPNTIAEIRRRGIALALINARLSPRSFTRWRLAGPLLRPPLDAFAPCLAQDETIAARLATLGARHVQSLGNLKFDAAPLPADEAELARLRAATRDRPLWLAASLHPGEAAAIAAAHRVLTATHPGLLTVVVPRHPPRAGDIAATFRAAGLTTAQRSSGAAPNGEIQVYVADTMGELGLFFRLCRIVVMGGSLVPHGGQNALEAARLDTAIILGPHMHNFPEVTAALLAAGGAEQIESASQLAPAVARLLADPALVIARAEAARRVADSGHGTVERVAAALAPLFDPLTERPEPEDRRASA